MVVLPVIEFIKTLSRHPAGCRAVGRVHRDLSRHLPVTSSLAAQSTSMKGDNTMFSFWLIVGIVIILLGIFNKQMLQLLGFKPMSEAFNTPNLKHSSRIIEKIVRWFVITLGVSFFVQGLGGTLPNNISYTISLLLLGLSGLMLLAILVITIANWKAR
jgi:hypothetical protein